MSEDSARPIYIGYPWGLRLRFISPIPQFPEGTALRAQFRRESKAARVIAEITSGDGITHIDEETIEIRLTAEQTEGMPQGDAGVGSVVMDLVRTDIPEGGHLGIVATIKTVTPVTR